MTGKRRQTVIVDDLMQRGYRYDRIAPPGRYFHPEFHPELTPKEMLELGVFCGKYMTDTRKEFPAPWFKRAKLSPNFRDCSLNYFGVDASQPLSVWRKKGWLHPDDPRGWFQWYAATTWAGECQKRIRDKSGAGTQCAATWPSLNAIANAVIRPAASARGRPFCTGLMTAEKYKGLPDGRDKIFTSQRSGGLSA